MNTQLTFQNVAIATIQRNNQTYISANDLALALKYSDTSAINRIYSRHSDEFTAEMTCSVNLTDLNLPQYEQRIFSLRGAHLIAMFARTSVAKEFRKWVLDILDKEISQNPVQIAPAVITADEEAMQVIVNLFHALNGAYEMGEKLRKHHPHLVREIDKSIGGHYLYNLHMPTDNALEKARNYVQAKSERIMFVKGMLSLLS